MKLSTAKGRIIYGAGFAAIAILTILRCFYGFGISFADEFAHPASVMRYFFGDRLLIDDWHPPTTLLDQVASHHKGVVNRRCNHSG